MMKLRAFTFILLSGLMLTACSKEPPTPGTPVNFAEACNETNSGKRIALDGFLVLPDSFKSDSSLVLRMYASEEHSGEPVGVIADIGREPHKVSPLETSYSDTDLIIRTVNEELKGYYDKVRVSGEMYIPSSFADVDFPCGLSNIYVESVPGL